jgi:hypothetical protein
MTGEIIDTSYNAHSSAANNEYYNNTSALQIRLDTKQIIEDIELFLRGAKVVVLDDGQGNIVSKRVEMGHKKANDRGIQAILNYISMIINPQVVQGNFDKEFYEYFIQEKNIELVEMLTDNLYNWEVQEDDINPIVDTIMNMVIPFLSRCIGNKERDSYANTIKTVESNTIQPQRSGFNIMK